MSSSPISIEVRVGARSDADIASGVFGGFVEHFGTGLYGGVFDLHGGHPRADVMAAVRALGVSTLRYPGGCFSDWYHWRDGVGEPSTRPRHERTYWTGLELPGIAIPGDLAERFGPPETNAFGTDEFLRYCVDLDIEPMLCVNFGTGTPEEAADWVAYTNRRPGSARPVRWWGVGNETYGGWELGHCTAEEYGRRFREFAAAMRAADPDIRLMAVGNCSRSYPGWNEGMLRTAGDDVDLVSLHFYFPGYNLGRGLADTENEVRQLLVGARYLGESIDRALVEIDELRPGLPVALDEWGLWTAWADLLGTNHRRCDSVFFGGCFNRMIERADRVRFSMISHLVNCMAPIQTSGERMHVTAEYLTFLLYRRHARRFHAPLLAEVPDVEVTPFGGLPKQQLLGGEASTRTMVPIVDLAATADATGTTVFAANGAVDRPVRATIRQLPPARTGRMRWVRGSDPYARNDFDAPDALGYAEARCTTDLAGVCTVDLPPATVTALLFDLDS